MKIFDLLRMSISNLWKRKLRTVLTVLGVVIGITSIVVMVALGNGLKQSMLDNYANYSSIIFLATVAAVKLRKNDLMIRSFRNFWEWNTLRRFILD